MHYSLTRGFGKLVIKELFEVDHKMLELKARVDDPKTVRRKLTSLKAQTIGTFKQNDVYFEVPRGRLKLREVEGNNETELIYYEREDVANPKLDAVCILKIQEGASLKTLLKRLLKTSVTVKKNREIYRYQGTLIHLDTVEKLGTFIEFERETSSESQIIRKNRQVLEKLIEKLEIKSKNLEKLSYGDLVRT